MVLRWAYRGLKQTTKTYKKIIQNQKTAFFIIIKTENCVGKTIKTIFNTAIELMLY